MIDAEDDLGAVRIWLALRSEGSHTHRSYRKEAARIGGRSRVVDVEENTQPCRWGAALLPHCSLVDHLQHHKLDAGRRQRRLQMHSWSNMRGAIYECEV
jgi:hypothetical protein